MHQLKIIFLIDTENFNAKFLSSLKDIASYKFTKIGRDNREFPVYSPSA